MHSRVENVSWGGKLVESIKGVLAGGLMVLLSFPILFFNEGRAVHRAQTLDEGRSAVVAADPAMIDPSHEGQLVHLSGEASTAETLTDPLGPSATGALRMRRTVEMYQWRESSETRTERRAGGGERRVTTYTYDLVWSETPIDSAQFDQPYGHVNPPMSQRSATFEATQARVGARTLTPALVSQVDNFQPLAVAPTAVSGLAQDGRSVLANGDGLFVGWNAADPIVGDLRVRWETAPGGPVSVLAAQAGPTFADWHSPSGQELEQNLELGTVGADAMFGTLESANVALTWGLRFLGWVFMFGGLMLVFRPLVAVADRLPFAGSLVGAGTFLAALVISTPLSLLLIALGWLFYRPLLGLLLLTLAVGFAAAIGYLVVRRGRNKNAARAASRAPAPMPHSGFGAPSAPMS